MNAIVLSTIDHSYCYWSYLNQLNAIVNGGPLRHPGPHLQSRLDPLRDLAHLSMVRAAGWMNIKCLT